MDWTRPGFKSCLSHLLTVLALGAAFPDFLSGWLPLGSSQWEALELDWEVGGEKPGYFPLPALPQLPQVTLAPGFRGTPPPPSVPPAQGQSIFLLLRISGGPTIPAPSSLMSVLPCINFSVFQILETVSNFLIRPRLRYQLSDSLLRAFLVSLSVKWR